MSPDAKDLDYSMKRALLLIRRRFGPLALSSNHRRWMKGLATGLVVSVNLRQFHPRPMKATGGVPECDL
jgi:hypothetical protein